MQYKICNLCFRKKSEDNFRAQRKQCKECLKNLRRENYKKSVCGFCNIEFRPDVQGRYKFCSFKCRFMAKVKKEPTTNCWLWQGAIQKKRGGYGTIQTASKVNSLAHRESYRLFHGDIPENKVILHSCHNYHCVSPYHLRIGTQKDNALDKIKKQGREALWNLVNLEGKICTDCNLPLTKENFVARDKLRVRLRCKSCENKRRLKRKKERY